MIIRKNTPNAPCAPRRGNEHIAQGNALGTSSKGNSRPEGANELILNAFALSGRGMMDARIYPGRCPGLGAFGLSGR